MVQPPAAAAPIPMDEPVPNFPTGVTDSRLDAPAQRFVTARATLYLFAPSISAIATKLGA